MTTPSTPFLMIDEQRLAANIERAARWADERGIVLRPHVKTHKLPEIARLQLAAGARGVTVATIGEAEVFADAGFADLFIAYPLWPDDAKRARLAALAGRATVRVGCDGVEAARRLAGLGVAVLVEVDSGHHRSGTAPRAAGVVALAAADAGLDVLGVFTFPGHSYAGTAATRSAAVDEQAALVEAAAALRGAGIEPRVVSAGSTPSLPFTGSAATEARPGVYVFNDAQQWELGSCEPDDIALTCHATVVSHAGGRMVLDCGSKILGADRAPHASGFGRLLDHPDARVVILSEHHAVVSGGTRRPLGSIVRVVPNHVCNAVNLVDELVRSTGGRWSVAARGRNG